MRLPGHTPSRIAYLFAALCTVLVGAVAATGAAASGGSNQASGAVIRAAGASMESFEVEVPPVSPRYVCDSSRRGTRSRCETEHALARPLATSGRVGFDGPPRMNGDIEIVYNQYLFNGKFRFARSGSGWRLQSATGEGDAEATWSMTFDDAEGSRLWGTFVSRKIHLRHVNGARVELVLDYSVEVSDGSGRFDGLTGDCDAPSPCHFDTSQMLAVTGPGQLPRAAQGAPSRAIGARARAEGEMDVAFAPGDPQVQLALPDNGQLLPQDPRPLQATAPPDSSCTARAENPMTGESVDLGQAIADAEGRLTFPGRLVPELLVSGLSSGLRIHVSCITPSFDPVPILPATAEVRQGRPTPRSNAGVVRIVNQSSFILYERSGTRDWFPPGGVGRGGTEEAAFETGFFTPRVGATYHYTGYNNVSGTPQSQGKLDMSFTANGSAQGSCEIGIDRTGPAKPTCTVSRAYEGRTIVFTVTVGEIQN
jgi:hypothetical protein